jgi:FAD/FMN-containing dehydrogenase
VKLRIAEEHVRGMNQGLQQRVKKAFDPSDIFAPGRVVGGI